MSVQAVANFLELAGLNHKLEKELKGTSVQGILNLGKENGFEFTQDEFRQFITEISALKSEDKDQLSDQAMEQITGGVLLATVCGAVLATAAVIRLGCAIDALACNEGWW